MEGHLEISRDDAQRIAELAAHPGFITLIKTVRRKLEPEYYATMQKAASNEEKVAAVDAWNSFGKVFSALALYPQEIKTVLSNQEGDK